MKYIKLTKNKKAIIDNEDFEWLNKYKWHAGNKGYAIHSEWINNKSSSIYMHRFILQKHNLYKNSLEIDHINRNKLDNRKCNLRLCTDSQNKANIEKLYKNTSGYKGVHWNKSHNKWEAKINFNNKNIFLGYFENKEDAGNKYIKKSKELYKEFSIFNTL